MRLQGKVCLVTGSGRRLGRAIALALAGRGGVIALHHHRSVEGAAETARAIRALGGTCRLFKADLSKPKAPEALAAKVIKAMGGCDVLVNSAAVFPRRGLLNAGAEDYDAALALNLRAPALLTKAVGGWNAAHRRPARIVNISDAAGSTAWPGHLPYSLSKAGVDHLTRASARALAPHVLVNAVAPGPMLPPEGAGQADNRAALKRTLLKRWGGADEIARAVVFLAETDFITGAVLPVDGGRHLSQ